MVSFELTDTQIIIAYRRLIDKHKLEITNKCTGIRHGHTLFKKKKLVLTNESGDFMPGNEVVTLYLRNIHCFPRWKVVK